MVQFYEVWIYFPSTRVHIICRSASVFYALNHLSPATGNDACGECGFGGGVPELPFDWAPLRCPLRSSQDRSLGCACPQSLLGSYILDCAGSGLGIYGFLRGRRHRKIRPSLAGTGVVGKGKSWNDVSPLLPGLFARSKTNVASASPTGCWEPRCRFSTHRFVKN